MQYAMKWSLPMSSSRDARGLRAKRRGCWVAFAACSGGSVAAALLLLHGASGGGDRGA